MWEAATNSVLLAFEQLIASRTVIIHALGVGIVLATTFALPQWYRLLRAGQRDEDDIRAVRKIRKDQLRRETVPADPMSVGFAEMKRFMQEEGRKSAVWGFVQNMIFFLLGTVTSILVPKFFP